jgi:hypothetical protein
LFWFSSIPSYLLSCLKIPSHLANVGGGFFRLVLKTVAFLIINFSPRWHIFQPKQQLQMDYWIAKALSHYGPYFVGTGDRSPTLLPTLFITTRNYCPYGFLFFTTIKIEVEVV